MCGPGHRGVAKGHTVLASQPVAGPLSAPTSELNVIPPRNNAEVEAVLEAASVALPAGIEGIKELLAKDAQAQARGQQVRTELLVSLGLTNPLTTKKHIRDALRRLGIGVPAEFQDGRKGPRKRKK